VTPDENGTIKSTFKDFMARSKMAGIAPLVVPLGDGQTSRLPRDDQ